jgi:hypothetical protein
MGGMLQVGQISWTKEIKYRLPVQTWKAMMELYYANSKWLCLRSDVFDRLYEYKVKNAIPTWEQTLERIIPVENPPGQTDESVDAGEQIH